MTTKNAFFFTLFGAGAFFVSSGVYCGYHLLQDNCLNVRTAENTLGIELRGETCVSCLREKGPAEACRDSVKGGPTQSRDTCIYFCHCVQPFRTQRI